MSHISDIKVKVKYPVDWAKAAKATKVLLIPESDFSEPKEEIELELNKS